MTKQKLIERLRDAFRRYRNSEGCSCCRDGDEHDKAEDILAELLGVEKHDDNSGYNWDKYKIITPPHKGKE